MRIDRRSDIVNDLVEFTRKLTELREIGTRINENTENYMGCGGMLEDVIENGLGYIQGLVSNEFDLS